MKEIRRGTTPTIEVEIPEEIDLASAKPIFLTISQNDCDLIEKDEKSGTIEGQKISFVLDQTETLRLSTKATAKIQIRLGVGSKKFGSQIEGLKVLDVLKEGEI